MFARWAAPWGFCGRCRVALKPGRIYRLADANVTYHDGPVLRCGYCAGFDAAPWPPYEMPTTNPFGLAYIAFRLGVAQWLHS
jgi:hypothetical protein